jgi:hypothetical protein
VTSKKEEATKYKQCLQGMTREIERKIEIITSGIVKMRKDEKLVFKE